MRARPSRACTFGARIAARLLLVCAAIGATCAAAAQTGGACHAPGVSGSGLIGLGGVSSLLQSLAANATPSPPCQPGEPASLPVDAPSRIAGNPVDLATGEKLDRVVDLFLPTAREPAGAWIAPGPDFMFSRLYASRNRAEGMLGPGWRHGFETRLHAARHADGRLDPQVAQADGRLVRFGDAEALPNGRLRHPARSRADGVLERAPPRDPAARPERWMWRWRDGRALVFGADGRLISISVEGSPRLAFDYDPQGRLASVSEPGGRVLRLAYGRRSGFERLVSVAGPNGARIDYGYDHAGRLTEVTPSDGPVVRYGYDDGSEARLTSVTLAGQGASRYRYDPLGRVISSQGVADGDPLEFAYAGAPEGGLTTVSRRGTVLGAYRWEHAEGSARLVESSGPGCPACPATGLRYGYRGGQLDRISSETGRWEAVRDRNGRLVEVRHARRTGRSLASAPGARGSSVRRLSLRWAPDPIVDRLTESVRPGPLGVGDLRVRLQRGSDGGLLGVLVDGFSPVVGITPAGPAMTGTRPVRAVFRPAEPGWRRAATGPLALPAGLTPLAPGVRAHVAGDGSMTRYWLDDLGRVVARHADSVGLTRWQYDDHGRLALEHDTDGAVARYRHDADGRLVERVVERPDREPVATRYVHQHGRLAHVLHPTYAESYDYDAAGRLTGRRVGLRLPDGRWKWFALGYRRDASTGAITGWSLPDGRWIVQARDAAGRTVGLRLSANGPIPPPTSDTTPPSITRQADRLLIQVSEQDRRGLVDARFGNGVQLRLRRDAAGRPTALCHRSPGNPAACDLLDHRLAWGPRGDLVRWARGEVVRSFLSGPEGRLLEARTEGEVSPPMRFAYDGNGNRRPVHRSAMRDAAGRQLELGRVQLRWAPGGLLERVERDGEVLARYDYGFRGERISKRTKAGVRHFLHDERRRLLAELDEDGAILRQYVHLGDAPLAIIDTDARGERIVFLHLNHLGAPELATDADANPVWRARYRPFGRAIIEPLSPDPSGGQGPARFDPRLRLPGQYEDPETGLHMNDHRYYDPDAGRYLSPDPLDLRAGSNRYAYAGNAPLTRVDPTGLLLFAFDGTGNGGAPAPGDDWSNVYKLARSYADGRVWYMAGVGVDDASGIAGGRLDAMLAGSARARVDWMLGQLDAYARSAEAGGRWLDVDVIGFSRGAAMGRDFVNRIADRIADGRYGRSGVCVRLRFLGLWDTVAQFGLAGADDKAWQLLVPIGVAYVAHAVALNEHRTLFPAESIVGSPLAGVRIERGFVGAHGDVGGSYGEGDLSDVTLGWMHDQARAAGVALFALTSEFARVTAPLLHDPSPLGAGDRAFRERDPSGAVVASSAMRVADVDGMQWRDTAAFIERYLVPELDTHASPSIVGEVRMRQYAEWLDANYGLSVSFGP